MSGALVDTESLCVALRPGADPAVAQCHPGWERLPSDLRRLLAQTWQAVVDGDSNGPALHERAHIFAAEYRRNREQGRDLR